ALSLVTAVADILLVVLDQHPVAPAVQLVTVRAPDVVALVHAAHPEAALPALVAVDARGRPFLARACAAPGIDDAAHATAAAGLPVRRAVAVAGRAFPVVCRRALVSLVSVLRQRIALHLCFVAVPADVRTRRIGRPCHTADHAHKDERRETQRPYQQLS